MKISKSLFLYIVGLAVIFLITFCYSIGKPAKGFAAWMYDQGEQQRVYSDEIVGDIVSPLEQHSTQGPVSPGDDTASDNSVVKPGVVGEHKDDGSNWGIPNMIRHFFGVE